MRYLKTNKDGALLIINDDDGWKKFDLTRQNEFLNSLILRGFNDFLVLTQDKNKDEIVNSKQIAKHHNHIHIQGFFNNNIENINK